MTLPFAKTTNFSQELRMISSLVDCIFNEDNFGQDRLLISNCYFDSQDYESSSLFGEYILKW